MVVGLDLDLDLGGLVFDAEVRFVWMITGFICGVHVGSWLLS